MQFVKNKIKQIFPGNKAQIREWYAFAFNWYCNNCFGEIKNGELHYHCFDCPGYDLCLKCYDLKVHSCDLLLPETHHPEHIRAQLNIEKNGGLINVINHCFHFYKKRPFIGVEVMNENVEGKQQIKYKWLSYEKVFKKSTDFYYGISDLLQITWDTPNSYSSYLSYLNWSETKETENPFIGICSRNCIEWLVSDFGSIFIEYTTVPIHLSFDMEQKFQVIENANVRIMCVGSEKRVLNCPCRTCSPSENSVKLSILEEFMTITESKEKKILECIISFDKICENVVERGKILGLEIIYFYDLLNRGKRIKQEKNEDFLAKKKIATRKANRNKLFTIMYTSGSTGVPKGVVISNDFWIDFLTNALFTIDPLVNFSFSPLAHGMDRRAIYATFSSGGRIALFQSDIANVLDHIQYISPTIFASTPRLWNEIYNNYLCDVKHLEEAQKKDVQDQGLTAEEQESIEEKKLEIRKKYSAVLGTRIKQVAVGGAPTSSDVFEFLVSTLTGVMISNTYGTTEVGGILHDGRVSGDMEIRIEDVPSMGYYTTDKPHPRGELLVKKGNMMDGYFNNEEENKKAFTVDGFYRTGDIVEQIGKEKYNIIDRIKNIFKLAQGEFVAPEYLENIYLKSPFIIQLFIYGNPQREYLIGVIVPNLKEILQFANEKGIIDQNNQILAIEQEHEQSKQEKEEKSDTQFRKILKNKEIRKLIKNEINRVGKGAGIASYEFIKDFYLEIHPFTLDNQLLTGPFKLNRKNIEKKYKEKLEKIYLKNESKYFNKREKNINKIIQQILFDEKSGQLGEKLQNSGKEFRIDSISAIRISEILKKQYGIHLEVNKLLNNLHASQSLQPVQWNAEFNLLPEDYSPCTSPCHLPQKSILLTGSTGFLGSFLLKYFLEKTDYFVFALIRDFNKINFPLYNCTNLDEFYSSYPSRCVFVLSDLTQDNLGIEEERYREIGEKVSKIFDCGALVHSVYNYYQIKPVNVYGNLQLIKLTTFGCKKQFHFISTAGVHSAVIPSSASSFGDDIYDVNPFTIHHIGGYNQSKLVSERILWKASSLGLQTFIYRPSRISPDSLLAFPNSNDFLILVIKGMIECGWAPITENVMLDLSAVDFVSEVIFKLSEYVTGGNYFVFDINNPPKSKALLPFDQLVDWLIELDYEIKKVSYEEWKLKLDDVSSSNPLYPLKHLFLQAKTFPNPAPYDCSKTFEVLTKKCSFNNLPPPFTKKLLAASLSHLGLASKNSQ